MATFNKKWMRYVRVLPCAFGALLLCLPFQGAADVVKVVGAKTPPTLLSMAPHGGQRGTTVTLLIDGTNLQGARTALFNHHGLSGTVLDIRVLPNQMTPPREGEVVVRTIIDDGAPKNRLKMEVKIAPEVEPGTYGFRISTPLGLTNLLAFEVGPFPEVHETKANDSLEEAQVIALPATINGEISRVGDIDHFRFDASADQELVFSVTAGVLASRLNARLSLFDEKGNLLAESEDLQSQDALLIHRIKTDGPCVIRIADAHRGSGGSHYYRLRAGEYPYLTEVFPLGLQAGQKTTVQVEGANLGSADSVTLQAEEAQWGKTVPVRVAGAWNELQAAVGHYPEQLEQEPNSSAASAQRISVPGTINGRIFTGPSEAFESDQDIFRFAARQGRRLVIEVEASRLGSALDSVIEILDLGGNPVPRAAVRCVAQTEVTLADRDSRNPGIRLVNWDDFSIDDYVMVGSEILQVESLPRGPDDDMRFKSFLGRRIAFFDTTPEAHAVGEPVYKMKLFPPATDFAPNGMPVFQLDYRNDDAGPLFESDSRLEFDPPQSGEYLLRLGDVRGVQSRRHAYRLTIREWAPDFILTTGSIRISGQFGATGPARETFNLPPGGRIPFNVLAYRIDGFDGDIEVAIEDLPPGVTAGRGIIPSGDDATVLVLQADRSVDFEPFPLKVVGRARIGESVVERKLDFEKSLGLVALSAPPEIQVTLDRTQVEIVPGKEVKVTVTVDRRDGFSARVPIDIRNLPHGVRVLDVGLNGILVTEEEERRAFTLYAEPWTRPVQRPFYAVARIETTSFIPHEHSSAPVELLVVRKNE